MRAVYLIASRRGSLYVHIAVCLMYLLRAMCRKQGLSSTVMLLVHAVRYPRDTPGLSWVLTGPFTCRLRSALSLSLSLSLCHSVVDAVADMRWKRLATHR